MLHRLESWLLVMEEGIEIRGLQKWATKSASSILDGIKESEGRSVGCVLFAVIQALAILSLYWLWGSVHTATWWSVLALLLADFFTVAYIRASTERDGYMNPAALRWTKAAIAVKLILLVSSLWAIVLAYQPAAYGPREACRLSITSFYEAHAMMSDERGRVVQLSPRQQQKLRERLRQGIQYSEAVTDAFLDSVHPQLKDQYRNHLVKGWSLFLQGLEIDSQKASVATQGTGIILVQQWQRFKEAHTELLYERVVSRDGP